MGQGFLDDMPDLGIEKPRKRRKKKSVTGIAPIIYMRVRCPNPKCRSTKVPVYDSSHLPIRYHKCSKCGLNFKSIEKS